MLLTEQLWRREFGASPDIVGRTVRLQNEDWIIAGVAPATLTVPNFRTERPDLFQLVAPSEGAPGAAVLVRLKPGVSRHAATAELDAIMRHANLADVRPVPMPMPLRLTRPEDWLAIRRPLLMLSGAVALLLLVACTNVAHLLLARGAARGARARGASCARRRVVRGSSASSPRRVCCSRSSVACSPCSSGGAGCAFWSRYGRRIPSSTRSHTSRRTTPSLSSLRRWRSAAAFSSASLPRCVARTAISRSICESVRRARRTAPSGFARCSSSAKSRCRRRCSSAPCCSFTHLFALEHTDVGFDSRGLYGITLSVPRGTQPPERAAFAAELRDRFAHVAGRERCDRIRSRACRSRVHDDRRVGNAGSPAVAAGRERRSGHIRRSARVFRDDADATAGGPHVRRGLVRRPRGDREPLARKPGGPGENPIGLRIRNAVARSRGSIIVIPGKAAAAAPDDPWQTIIGVVPDVITNLTQGAQDGAVYRPLLLANEPRRCERHDRRA